jgi:ribosome biogenesis GTPase
MTFDLSSLGWDEHFSSAYDRHDRSDQQPARVIRVDRGICTLSAADGTRRASIGGALLAAAAHDPTRLPCTGDWAVLRTWPDERLTIEAVLPRRTALIRASAGAEALGQILVANVDTVAVVVPVDPEPDLGLVERLLALAWESGATPVVALTKVDLASHPEVLVEEVGEIAPGVDVFGVSAATGAGLDKVRALAGTGRTLGLLGASGSGKSTLVNALAGATVMPTQPIRRADGRGRHTTTHRALITLPGGGAVIDIPGIRAAGLFAGAEGLARTFADIVGLAARCRFDDCTHEHEPGCAVLAGLETGELSPRRMEHWRRLQREIEREARRHDVRIAAHERRRWARGQARPYPRSS